MTFIFFRGVAQPPTRYYTVYILGFPEIGVPPVPIRVTRSFPYKPCIFWGTPIYENPTYNHVIPISSTMKFHKHIYIYIFIFTYTPYYTPVTLMDPSLYKKWTEKGKDSGADPRSSAPQVCNWRHAQTTRLRWVDLLRPPMRSWVAKNCRLASQHGSTWENYSYNKHSWIMGWWCLWDFIG